MVISFYKILNEISNGEYMCLIHPLHSRLLADQDEDGEFTFYEFTTAMHLIFVTKLGYILPMNLDPYSILPPSVSNSSPIRSAE